VLTVGSESGTPSANPEIKVSKPKIEPEEPLQAEICAFLHSVRTRQKPRVTLENGRSALAVALEILSQIDAHTSRLKLGG
jgi:hypothetical protein